MIYKENSVEDIQNYKAIISNIVTETIRTHGMDLTEEYIQNITSHLAVAVLRIKSATYIPLSQSQIASNKNKDFYKVAKELCTRVGEELDIEFPKSETALASIYLSKCNQLDFEFDTSFSLLDDEVVVIIEDTIQEIFDQSNVDFRDDINLFTSLGLHLTPAVERLLNDDQITNPLLDKIKAKHSKAYEYASILNKNVEKYYHKSFIEDEVAYFALHFVVALKKL